MRGERMELAVRIAPWVLVVLFAVINFMTQQQLRESWASVDHAIATGDSAVTQLQSTTTALEHCASTLQRLAR